MEENNNNGFQEAEVVENNETTYYQDSVNAGPNYSETVDPVNSDNGSQPGKGAAVASLVLGIVSIVFWFFGVGAFIGLVTGIIGLICSSNAKKQGYKGGMQTAGFVCSLIGVIGSALVFVACVACVGALGTAGLLESM